MQELLLVGVLCLLILGSDRMTNMARDAGRLVSQVRESVDDFKSEMGFDGYVEETEDSEVDDEAEWLYQGDSYVNSEEDHAGARDPQSPVYGRELDEGQREVHLER